MNELIPIHQLDVAHTAPCNARRFAAFDGEEDNEEPHRHNYYEILFFSGGRGNHMIDFENHPLQETTLHFISPGQVHALNRKRGVDGYVVNFTKDFFVLNGGCASVLNEFPAFSNMVFPVLRLSPDDFLSLTRLVDQMYDETKNSSSIKDQVLVAYINLLLTRCKAFLMELPEYGHPDPARQLAQRFNALLEDNYITWRKVGDYAEQLNLSPNHLSTAIKKMTGKTVGDLIHLRLLLEARRLLLHSEVSVKEIAYQLNFSDPPYFTRFFKSHTGLSPENFRKDVRAQYGTEG